MKLTAGPADVLHLLLEKTMSLLEGAELFEGQRIDGTERRQLRLDGGRTKAASTPSAGPGTERSWPSPVRNRFRDAEPRRPIPGGRRIRPGRAPGAARGRGLGHSGFDGGPLATEIVEPGAAGTDLVELARPLLVQPLAQSREPRRVTIDHVAQAVHDTGVGLQSASTLPGLIALGHVPGQAPLDVFKPVLEHGAPLGQGTDADLEIASATLDLHPTFLMMAACLVGRAQTGGGFGGCPFELGQPPVDVGQTHGVTLDPVDESAVVTDGPPLVPTAPSSDSTRERHRRGLAMINGAVGVSPGGGSGGPGGIGGALAAANATSERSEAAAPPRPRGAPAR